MQNQLNSITRYELHSDRTRFSINEIIHLIKEYPITIEAIEHQETPSSIDLSLTLQGNNHFLELTDHKIQGFADSNGCRFTSHSCQTDQDHAATSRVDNVSSNDSLTLLTHSLSPRTLQDFYCLLSEYSIGILKTSTLTVSRLSSPDYMRQTCIDYNISSPTDHQLLRKAISVFTNKTGADLILQRNGPLRRTPKLIAFDMDSTLIQAEVIDELAKVAGIGDQVAKITESAMRGDIDFDTSFRQRLALLEGMPTGQLLTIANSLPLSPGTERLMHYLKKLGIKTAIISGGFEYFGDFLQKKLGFDFVITNKLDIENGKVSGKVKGTIINRKQKSIALEHLANQEGIPIQQTIAVGDGANDLDMLSTAGRGIAYHAKPIVQASVEHALTHFSLDGILYILGYSDHELSMLK